MIKEKGHDYMCVSRSSLKNYKVEAGAATVTVTDNKKQKINLCRVKSARNTDYYLKVESGSKELKERSMNEQFRARFEAGLQTIADSLTKNGGVKQEDKVYERIGRLKQKYPSIGRYFDILVEVKDDVEANRKKKGAEASKEKKRSPRQNIHDEVILIRRCSEPNQPVRKLYDALKYKYAPFVKKKSVVHKSEINQCQFIEQQLFFSD